MLQGQQALQGMCRRWRRVVGALVRWWCCTPCALWICLLFGVFLLDQC